MQEKAGRCLSLLLYGAVLVGGLWLGINYILPWTAPFIAAFIFASALEPLLEKICSRGFKRSAAAGILSLSALALIAAAMFLITSRCLSEAGDFVKKSPQLVMAVGEGLEKLESRAFGLSSGLPPAMEEYIRQASRALMDAVYSLPAILSQHILDFLGRTAQKSPTVLLFTVTAGLGTYFISASYPEVLSFLSRQLPKSLRQKIRALGKELKKSLGGFLRAQFILMLMTFFQLLGAFLILKTENPVGTAALTALIDALPVFGTGIVLIPWAAYSFILGNYRKAVGLLIVWGTVNLVRSCAQAKLTGDQIGLNPIASLAAVYMGWKVWGVGGMLLFPLLFSLFQQLWEKDLIRIRK